MLLPLSAAAQIITTIAGTGSIGYNGDNGPCVSSIFSRPQDMCLDILGNLYIADVDNNVIRKINSSDIITTFAGNGVAGYGGNGGPATAASLYAPTGITTDASG